MLKKIVVGVAALVVAYCVWQSPVNVPAASTSPAEAKGPDTLERAMAAHARGVRVEGSGIVERILRDDNEGSRHQRIIIRTAAGRSVLLAHNIDLAPRVERLQEGQPLSLSGEYVWNDRGGVVHWTHRDPSNRHEAGFIRYGGRVYR